MGCPRPIGGGVADEPRRRRRQKKEPGGAGLSMRQRPARSVAVEVPLGLDSLGDADIGRLVGAKLRQLAADLVEVQPRDLLTQVLRSGVDLALVLAGIGPQ